MQKILITGGAGFIGSNLVDHFLSNGYEVVCLDDFATGKRENLEEAQKSEAFTLIEGDIRDLVLYVQGIFPILRQVLRRPKMY